MQILHIHAAAPADSLLVAADWILPRCLGRTEPLSRLELETSPLPRECSTAELQGRVVDGPGWI